jgi:glycosyltransferase involved in cell wall biosynthesis
VHTVLDIALPFYGDVGYLKLAVESIRNQSSSDWHLYVSDDGYPDPSVKEYFEELNDSRITYSRNEVNLGANRNFQHCLSLVKSELVTIMGADDLMHSDYVAQIIEAFHDDDIYIVHPQVNVIDEHNNRIKPLTDKMKNRISLAPGTYRGEEIAISLMKGNWTYFPAIAWRQNAITSIGFREGLFVSQDLGLLLDVVKKNGKLKVLPNHLFSYRRHSESDSSVRAIDGDRFREEKEFFSILQKEFDALNWKQASRAAKFHFSSRLHAGKLIPTALVQRKNPLPLIRHLFF